MMYYRAKEEAYDYFTGYPMIKGELFTDLERNRLVRYISDDKFDIVDISRKQTHKYFGVRKAVPGAKITVYNFD